MIPRPVFVWLMLSLVVLVAGCATSSWWEHPETHDVRLCERRPVTGTGIILWGTGPGALVAAGWYALVEAPLAIYQGVSNGSAYADCKTAAETDGFVRLGPP